MTLFTYLNSDDMLMVCFM